MAACCYVKATSVNYGSKLFSLCTFDSLLNPNSNVANTLPSCLNLESINGLKVSHSIRKSVTLWTKSSLMSRSVKNSIENRVSSRTSATDMCQDIDLNDVLNLCRVFVSSAHAPKLIPYTDLVFITG